MWGAPGPDLALGAHAATASIRYVSAIAPYPAARVDGAGTLRGPLRPA